MYYYKGSINNLLGHSYKLLKAIGFNVEWVEQGDTPIFSFICHDFKTEGDSGTSEWIYSTGYSNCSAFNDFRNTLKVSRTYNKTNKVSNSLIHEWNGEEIPKGNSHVKTFDENEWTELLLSCMIPYTGYSSILGKFSIPEDSNDYKMVAREIKLSIVFDECS